MTDDWCYAVKALLANLPSEHETVVLLRNGMCHHLRPNTTTVAITFTKAYRLAALRQSKWPRDKCPHQKKVENSPGNPKRIYWFARLPCQRGDKGWIIQNCRNNQYVQKRNIKLKLRSCIAKRFLFAILISHAFCISFHTFFHVRAFYRSRLLAVRAIYCRTWVLISGIIGIVSLRLVFRSEW